MTKTERFSEYASYHADRRNRICHAFGIPLIVLGIMGLAAPVRLGTLNLAIVLALAVLLYYTVLDLRGAQISLAVFVALYAISTRLQWELNAMAFVLGWILQLIGHRFEGTKPKFTENLIYLLIGPLYIFEEVFDALSERVRVR